MRTDEELSQPTRDDIAYWAVGFGAAYFATALTMGVWFPRTCLAAGFAVAWIVDSLCNRLDIIPEDPDKLITLSLPESSERK